MTIKDFNSIMSLYVRRYEKRKKMGIRMDAKDWREDASARLAYGIAKSMGIDTEGMEPKEVWKAIRGQGGEKMKAGMNSYLHGGAKKLQKNNKEQPNGKLAAKGKMQKAEYPEVKGMSSDEVKHMLGETKKLSNQFYDKAAKEASNPKNFFLRTFTTHQADHIRQVIEKTNQAINEVEKLGKNNPVYRGKIDRKSLLIAAQLHDTGMDGGNYKPNADGDALRSAHGMNSAIHCLELRDQIKKLGGNPDLVAFLAFSHTKSNSGVGDLANPNDWKVALDKIEKEVEEYNAVNKDKPIKFDKNNVFGGEPDEKNIGGVACCAASLRMGDANREANIPLRTQAGGKYKIAKSPKGQFNSPDEEADASEVVIEHEGGIHKLCDTNDKYFNGLDANSMRYSKTVVLGEQNMIQANAKYVEGNTGKSSIQENIVLRSGNDVPYCTTRALEERIGELNTINGIPRTMDVKMTGVKSENDMTESTKEAYRKFWENSICLKLDKKDKNKFAYEIEDISLSFDDGSSVKLSDMFGTKKDIREEHKEELEKKRNKQ